MIEPVMSETREGELARYAVRVELHPFQSLTLSDEQFLTGAADAGTPTMLAGNLRIAQAGTERLPTVILMHGSGGLGGNAEFWQRELNALGVSTFAIDGFTGRGLTTVNTNQAALGRTNLILDIYRALEVLGKHPRVDPQRVAIMGFSRGGQAALYASLKRFDALWNRSGIAPAAYLPVYPDCATTFVSDTDVAERPIRILAGGGDDYNPAAPCAAYVERLTAAGRDVTLTVYPNAQHVFDNPIGPETPTPIADAQTVRNCTIREEPVGRLINARTGVPFTYADPCVERGPHIGSDATARAAALQATAETLRAVFKLK
jgi:dienelactone hydrolase